MATPQEIAQKFQREWLESKNAAKTRYRAASSTIAQSIINQKETMIANYTKSLNEGRLERGLAKYIGNTKLADAYDAQLDSITSLSSEKLLKIEEDVSEKRSLAGKIADVIQALKDADSGERTVPAGLSDPVLRSIVNTAIISNQDILTSESTTSQVLTAIETTLTTYGFPLAT